MMEEFEDIKDHSSSTKQDSTPRFTIRQIIQDPKISIEQLQDVQQSIKQRQQMAAYIGVDEKPKVIKPSGGIFAQLAAGREDDLIESRPTAEMLRKGGIKLSDLQDEELVGKTKPVPKQPKWSGMDITGWEGNQQKTVQEHEQEMNQDFERRLARASAERALKLTNPKLQFTDDGGLGTIKDAAETLVKLKKSKKRKRSIHLHVHLHE